ncbi:hypothetical protein HU230_0008060 [Bradyrhizobium quebecense]|uniref:Uncharacterized protein n=1 Tax=Bradyrhizobium quebecense TaxID=2748629 RepID=A0A974ADP1_9BRAD|nr:hypothetical protein [Bradyrhizobium quebecense]UGA45981.1 hypothetical protein HU230_0008060 [Bradyrhizobium quebecense]
MRHNSQHYVPANLPVRVPRGQEGYWQIICQLADTKGDFTINDVDDQSNVGRGDIQVYVWSLSKAGFLDIVRAGKANRASTVFRLVKRQRIAPRVRRDGSIIPATAQENLWTAIRTLKSFGLRELAFAATTEDVRPTYEGTKRYVMRLTDAGYLVITSPSGGPKGATWRLKPSMNTGPKAPERRAVNADVMWDPNTKVFVGAEPIATEARQ